MIYYKYIKFVFFLENYINIDIKYLCSIIMSQKYECRICYDEESNKTNLIHPCACNGTNRYVHRKCLDEWRNFGEYTPNRKRCSECNQKYVMVFSYPNEEYNLHFLSTNDDEFTYQAFIVSTCLISFSLIFNIIDNHYDNLSMRSFLNSQNANIFERHFDNSTFNALILYILYFSYSTLLITYFFCCIFTGLIYYNIQRRAKYFALTFMSHFIKLILLSHFIFSIHLAEAIDSEILIVFTSLFNFFHILIFSSIFENHNKKLKLLNKKFNKKQVKNLEQIIIV